jgi:hypothetical protein
MISRSRRLQAEKNLCPLPGVELYVVQSVV